MGLGVGRGRWVVAETGPAAWDLSRRTPEFVGDAVDDGATEGAGMDVPEEMVAGLLLGSLPWVAAGS